MIAAELLRETFEPFIAAWIEGLWCVVNLKYLECACSDFIRLELCIFA
jgi:hypothetical protein